MRQQQVTHVGFSDESNWKQGRFRSLGLVTTSVDYVDSLSNMLRCFLLESNMKEFKWKQLDGDNERRIAEEMCKFAIHQACAGRLRVDVLIWDINDTRHNISGRDDIANLQRMYYHLFRNVMRARWPENAVWRFHPDEHTGLNWETVRDYLIEKSVIEKSVTATVDTSLFSREPFRIMLRRDFGIEEIQQVSSEHYPLLQLADLFAGLAVFSYDKYDRYAQWLESQLQPECLFDELENPLSLSNSERARFPVLKIFDEECKRRKLGVSLNEKKGLWTPRPQNPINFWMYEPQHPLDKAPVRKRDDLRPT